MLVTTLQGCMEQQAATVLQNVQDSIEGEWTVTITNHHGQTTSHIMRFRITGTALQYSTFHDEAGAWSGYIYLGTLQDKAFTYETTGILCLASNADTDCMCTAHVTTQSEWIFSKNSMVGRITEKTALVYGTAETCPQGIFTWLPQTKTTIWVGNRTT